MESRDLRPLIARIRSGERAARDELFEALYGDLQRRARFELARARRMSLNTTVVLHEAYLKLAGVQRLAPEDHGHFMRIAARAMRSVIVDRARRRLSKKRGGTMKRVALDVVDAPVEDRSVELVALDEALLRLEKEDQRLAEIVQLRFFAGQSVAETAAALGISDRTVKRDWRLARAILHTSLSGGSDSEQPSDDG